MKKLIVIIILLFISAFILFGCLNASQILLNTGNNNSNDIESIKLDAVYKNKESLDMLIVGSEGSFILYKNNEHPTIAVGGKWDSKGFIIDFEYVECPESTYVFKNKEISDTQNSFTFNKDEWVHDAKLSPKNLYEEKINLNRPDNFTCEYTVINNNLIDEEILTNSVLQFGECVLGATYSNIFIFSEDHNFEYYCSGYGAETKESAEKYKNRIKYLKGSWVIENNQILLKIEESEIKSGGKVKYDVISMYKLVDYEITHELDGNIANIDYKIHIDEKDPRFESFIEMSGQRFYFLSGYKIYNNKEKLDSFIEDFAY